MAHSSHVALCSAFDLGLADGSLPEWVHLLPAGEIRTIDGRGPYRVSSMQAVASLLPAGQKLPIDENHATDKGGRALGMPAPARGWIVALEARSDGLWGKVEWTAEGRRLMVDKAYRGISPAILHSKSGDVIQVLRASLTNTPNLEGLTSLHTAADTASQAFDKSDRHVVEMLGLGVEEYRAAKKKSGQQDSDYTTLHSASAQGKPEFSETDTKVMKIFGMTDAEYREAVKKLKKDRQESMVP